MIIDQFHGVFSQGDAIGNNMLAIRDALLSQGFKSCIFARVGDAPSLNMQEMQKCYKKEDVLIIHYSLWDESLKALWDLPCRKIMAYHNITPKEFFNGYKAQLYEAAQSGRDKLLEIQPYFDFAFADSSFNAEELSKYGYKDVLVVPITIDTTDFVAHPRPFNQSSPTRIFFIGRIAPNKCFEDIIKSFYFYKKYWDSDALLTLIGSWDGLHRYKRALDRLIEKLELKDVVFTGKAPFSRVLKEYRQSDMLLCMSEHEGFCVPLAEAMWMELPIIAYNSSAIAETLGEGGFLVNEKDYAAIAELMHLLKTNEQLRRSVIEKQKMERGRFSKEKQVEYLQPLLRRIGAI